MPARPHKIAYGVLKGTTAVRQIFCGCSVAANSCDARNGPDLNITMVAPTPINVLGNKTTGREMWKDQPGPCYFKGLPPTKLFPLPVRENQFELLQGLPAQIKPADRAPTGRVHAMKCQRPKRETVVISKGREGPDELNCVHRHSLLYYSTAEGRETSGHY